MNLSKLRETGRALISVEEAADVCGIGRTAAYEAVRRGQLPSLRLGRRLFVPVTALLKLLGDATRTHAKVDLPLWDIKDGLGSRGLKVNEHDDARQIYRVEHPGVEARRC